MNEIMSNKYTKIVFIVVLGFVLFNILGYVITGLFLAAGVYYLLKGKKNLPVLYQEKEELRDSLYYINEIQKLRRKIKKG